MTMENKITAVHGRCELPCTCAGDATTYTTDLYPHRKISIPYSAHCGKTTICGTGTRFRMLS